MPLSWKRYGDWIAATLIILLFVNCAAIASANPNEGSGADSLQVSKVTFKATYIAHGEKASRTRLSTDGATIREVGDGDSRPMDLLSTDSITVQATITDNNGSPTAIEQAFLRFVDVATGRDNLFIMRRRGQDIKIDLDLKREIKADLDFWKSLNAYRIEVVLGDVRLARSLTWVVTNEMRFTDSEGASFIRPPKGVFDFDVGVSKTLLPEFESPIPKGEKRAPKSAVISATISVIVPLLVLLMIWMHMNVFSFDKCKDFEAVVGLQICVVLHIAAMVMFWLQWNIVTTWKVMAGIMVPTLIFIRALLHMEGGVSKAPS